MISEVYASHAYVAMNIFTCVCIWLYPSVLRVRFETASYSGEEGGSVEIRILASSFERPFRVQVILIDLDQERTRSDIRVEATTGQSDVLHQ